MDKINFNDALFEVFKSIKKDKLVNLSAEIDKDPHLMELKSAYSKCLEFNIAVNRHRENWDEAFLMVPALRGIVEDLICLKYNMRFKSDDQIKYMTLIREINFLDSLIAQRNFFAENNPFQAIVGGGQAVQDLMERRASCSDRIREFYLSHGLPSRRPNVKEMASTVGLSTIYSYIYFAASNFVHFNPYALLRLGWGPKGEPCQFSVAHFGGYYRDLSAFCGALLYLEGVMHFGRAVGQRF